MTTVSTIDTNSKHIEAESNERKNMLIDKQRNEI